MTGFQLAGLDLFLLEKVITKLDYKSYLHMRQTCRGMDEFIRRSRNISVHLPKDEEDFCLYHVKFCKKDANNLRLYSGVDPDKIERDIEAFNGVRFYALNLGKIDLLCDYLRKYRITCEDLNMVECTWTKEECATLLKILKPLAVELISCDSNRCEAVFQSKTLEIVSIACDEKDLRTMAPRLLSTFKEVRLWPGTLLEPKNTLKIILQMS